MTPGSEILHLRSIIATPVSVPMNRPLGTSADRVESAPLLLLDLETREGVVGRSHTFCYKPGIAKSLCPILSELGEALAGSRLAPVELSERIAGFFKLAGLAGPLSSAASAIDVAAWDALAIANELPLAMLLGSAPKPIPAYNSNGLGLVSAPEAADEAEQLVEEGGAAIKVRVGRSSHEDDLTVVRAVRDRVPVGIHVMADYNQACSFAEAMHRCRGLDGEGLYWIEEPIRHDDYLYAALIAEAVHTPIQIGENLTGIGPMRAAFDAVASDDAMLDLDRIGGVTGWRNAVALAESWRWEVSSHLYPEASAHLLSATPTRHWLECVDWASPILQQPLSIIDGSVTAPSRPGVGIEWDAAAIAKFRI